MLNHVCDRTKLTILNGSKVFGAIFDLLKLLPFQDGGKKEDAEVKNFNAEQPLLDKQDGENEHSTGNLALYEVC